MMTRRDDLRIRDPTSPELPKLNYDIQNRIYAHQRQQFRDFVETLDQKTDVTKLWSTIKGVDGRVIHEAENEAFTFQYTQNEALRIATGCHKMSCVDHLHV